MTQSGLAPRRGLFCRALHAFAHSIGANEGFVVAATDDHGVVWTAFRCYHCGQVDGAGPILGMTVAGTPPRKEDYR